MTQNLIFRVDFQVLNIQLDVFSFEDKMKMAVFDGVSC